MKNSTMVEGSLNPLGVTFIKNECADNFALYSKHATDVTVVT